MNRSVIDSCDRLDQVSVVICCHSEQRLADIRKCVESVLRQSRKADQIVVAVDNNRTLHARLRSEMPSGVQVVLNEEQHGLSATRNIGLRNTLGGLVCFLDDDAVADSNWLQELTRAFSSNLIIAASGEAKLVWPGGNPPLWFPWEFDWILGGTRHKRLIQRGSDIPSVSGCNCIFRRLSIIEIGSWNPDLGFASNLGPERINSGGEEAELCARMLNRWPHSRIVFVPSARILHTVSSNKLGFARVVAYAWKEGKIRRLVEQMAPGYSAHRRFFFNIVVNTLHSRLKSLNTLSALLQLATMSLLIVAVGLGYVGERLRERLRPFSKRVVSGILDGRSS